jgi:hypothetical protein
MKNEPQLIRKGRVISNVAEGVSQEFKSISQAKRWSREWQQKNGGLGRGFLRVAR